MRTAIERSSVAAAARIMAAAERRSLRVIAGRMRLGSFTRSEFVALDSEFHLRLARHFASSHVERSHTAPPGGASTRIEVIDANTR